MYEQYNLFGWCRNALIPKYHWSTFFVCQKFWYLTAMLVSTPSEMFVLYQDNCEDWTVDKWGKRNFTSCHLSPVHPFSSIVSINILAPFHNACTVDPCTLSHFRTIMNRLGYLYQHRHTCHQTIFGFVFHSDCLFNTKLYKTSNAVNDAKRC